MKPSCFVLFELTPATIPVLWAASKVYDDVRFVLCAKKIRDKHYDTIKRLGARQISDKSQWGDGQYNECASNIVNGAERLARQHHLLSQGLQNYLGTENAAALLNQVMVAANDEELFAAAALGRFLERDAPQFSRVDIFALTPPGATQCERKPAANVRWLTFHQKLLWLAGLLFRVPAVMALLAFPLLSALMLWRKGVVIGKSPDVRWRSAPFLFFHREAAMVETGAGAMHCFHNGMLHWDECLHIPMQTSVAFSSDKAAYLAAKGATALGIGDLACSWRWIMRRVFVDFWRHLASGLAALVISPYVNVGFLRQLSELLHLIHVSELLVDNFEGPVAFFETENSLLGRAVAVLAPGRGIRTASMLHGGGGQILVTESRANLCFDLFFTYGSAVETLRAISPRLGQIAAIGSWETDAHTPLPQEGILPDWLVRDRARYKVIAMLASFYVPFTQEELEFRRPMWFEDVWVYFDEDENRAFCEKFMADFFRWVVETPDVVLLWKTKKGKTAMEHQHRWAAPMLKDLPADRVIHLDTRYTPAQVIRESDLVVGNGASTVFMLGMQAGVPTVMIDGLLGGWTRRYHPLLGAESGAELVANLTALHGTKLSDEIVAKVQVDWDVVGPPGETAWIRGRRQLHALAGLASPSNISAISVPQGR